MSGLPTIEGAVFALIGLLLAFTISGALQRFDVTRHHWCPEQPREDAVASIGQQCAQATMKLARQMNRRLDRLEYMNLDFPKRGPGDS